MKIITRKVKWFQEESWSTKSEEKLKDKLNVLQKHISHFKTIRKALWTICSTHNQQTKTITTCWIIFQWGRTVSWRRKWKSSKRNSERTRIKYSKGFRITSRTFINNSRRRFSIQWTRWRREDRREWEEWRRMQEEARLKFTTRTKWETQTIK